MADQHEENSKKLYAMLTQVAQSDPAHLLRRTDLGRLNFESQESNLAKVIGMAKDAIHLPLEHLPPTTVEELLGALQPTLDSLRGFESFNPTHGGDVQGAHTKCITRFTSAFGNLAPRLMLALPYLAFKAGRGSEQLESLKLAVQQTQEIKAEAEAARDAARDAGASIGVGRFSKVFKDSADEHDKSSHKWLMATTVVALATVVVALLVVFLFPADGEARLSALIQGVITRLAVILVLFYAAVWCGRNYRAHRHLAVLNRHRQAALTTFETFVHGASDDQTKNAVLLEATRCIFTAGSTGYTGAEDEGPGSRIIEIFKTVAGSGQAPK
ncbi:MAG: hypothetical protein L0Z62_07260 [Gemmataceae bacterium]|nr:hypothetical protein [Gemmataceae bacterium]